MDLIRSVAPVSTPRARRNIDHQWPPPADVLHWYSLDYFTNASSGVIFSLFLVIFGVVDLQKKNGKGNFRVFFCFVFLS